MRPIVDGPQVDFADQVIFLLLEAAEEGHTVLTRMGSGGILRHY